MHMSADRFVKLARSKFAKWRRLRLAGCASMTVVYDHGRCLVRPEGVMTLKAASCISPKKQRSTRSILQISMPSRCGWNRWECAWGILRPPLQSRGLSSSIACGARLLGSTLVGGSSVVGKGGAPAHSCGSAAPSSSIEAVVLAQLGFANLPWADLTFNCAPLWGSAR